MNRQFVKFIFVGILNTAFGYAIYSLFIYLNMHYSVASLLATVVGVMFNFKSLGVLVFRSSNNRLIYKFISVYLITYLLNIMLLSVLNNYYNPYISAAILIIPLALVSYFLNSRYVFGKK